MFPPDTKYRIPRNVWTFTKNVFVQNIDMGVVYNGLDSFSTKPPLLFEIDQNQLGGELNLHAPRAKTI